MTDLILLNEDANKQIENPEIQKALLENTFKGFNLPMMKQAILEGIMRGFTFGDFLKKNIYAIKYGNSYSLVTSINDSRKIGMKSGVVGVLAPVYVDKQDGAILTCSVTVQKKVDGYVGDFTALVYFDEFYKAGNTYNGVYTKSMWDKMPRVMIAKVAEMHALRKACPEELAQAYIEEEMKEEVIKEVEPIDYNTYKTKFDNLKSYLEFGQVWSALPILAKKALQEDKEFIVLLKNKYPKPEPKEKVKTPAPAPVKEKDIINEEGNNVDDCNPFETKK